MEAELSKVEAHEAALERLMDMDFDLIWININLPDHFLHRNPKAVDKYSPHLKSLLQRLDRLVERASRRVENLVVVSDHGFTLYPETVSVNSLLLRKGLAVTAERPEDTFILGRITGGKEVRVGARKVRVILKLSRGPLRGVLRAGYKIASKLSMAILRRENSSGGGERRRRLQEYCVYALHDQL